MTKKLILIFISFGLSSISFSQLNFSLKFGATQSFVKESMIFIKHDMHAKSGFQIGATANLILLNNLEFRPSIQFTQKGFRSYEGDIDGPQYFDRNISRTYLELPADFVYRFPISTNTDLLIGAGPVLGFGLYGNANVFTKEIDAAGQISTRRTSSNIFKGKPSYKRFDFGADFLTGIQYKKLILTFNYTHGLVNIFNDDVVSQITKNRNFVLAIAYVF